MLLPPIPDIPPPDTAGGVDGAEDTGEGRTEEPPAFADGAEKRFNANCLADEGSPAYFYIAR